MANFNKVFLMGNLTRDPELRRLPSGSAVVELGLALNRSYTTRDGEKRDEVTYIDVSVWDRQAETCAEYLKKGRPVFVEGYLKMDTWDDKTTGEKRSKVKVQAERVQFLGGRDGAPGGGGGDDDYSAPAPRESSPPPRRSAPSGESRGPSNGSSRSGYNPQTGRPAGRPPAPPVDNDNDDDDIPF